MTTPEIEVCGACGHGPNEHQGMRHPFSPKGASTSWLKPQKVQPPESSLAGATMTPPRSSSFPATLPFDPVLRQALITKGVLTPDDLAAAETTIRALGLGGGLSGATQHEGPAQGQ
jgi:hypothetical protein